MMGQRQGQAEKRGHETDHRGREKVERAVKIDRFREKSPSSKLHGCGE